MSALWLLLGGLIGCLVYRLGRREGEVGRVLPIKRRRPQREASDLLEQIESYDGGGKR